jgi:hypothetical protein
VANDRDDSDGGGDGDDADYDKSILANTCAALYTGVYGSV